LTEEALDVKGRRLVQLFHHTAPTLADLFCCLWKLKLAAFFPLHLELLQPPLKNREEQNIDPIGTRNADEDSVKQFLIGIAWHKIVKA
jgi:hypothetical protein